MKSHITNLETLLETFENISDIWEATIALSEHTRGNPTESTTRIIQNNIPFLHNLMSHPLILAHPRSLCILKYLNQVPAFQNYTNHYNIHFRDERAKRDYAQARQLLNNRVNARVNLAQLVTNIISCLNQIKAIDTELNDYAEFLKIETLQYWTQSRTIIESTVILYQCWNAARFKDTLFTQEQIIDILLESKDAYKDTPSERVFTGLDFSCHPGLKKRLLSHIATLQKSCDSGSEASLPERLISHYMNILRLLYSYNFNNAKIPASLRLDIWEFASLAVKEYRSLHTQDHLTAEAYENNTKTYVVNKILSAFSPLSKHYLFDRLCGTDGLLDSLKYLDLCPDNHLTNNDKNKIQQLERTFSEQVSFCMHHLLQLIKQSPQNRQHSNKLPCAIRKALMHEIPYPLEYMLNSSTIKNDTFKNIYPETIPSFVSFFIQKKQWQHLGNLILEMNEQQILANLQTDIHGNTLLHHFVSNNHYEATKKLLHFLSSNASLSSKLLIRDNNGKTPLDIAFYNELDNIFIEFFKLRFQIIKPLLSSSSIIFKIIKKNNDALLYEILQTVKSESDLRSILHLDNDHKPSALLHAAKNKCNSCLDIILDRAGSIVTHPFYCSLLFRNDVIMHLLLSNNDLGLNIALHNGSQIYDSEGKTATEKLINGILFKLLEKEHTIKQSENFSLSPKILAVLDKYCSKLSLHTIQLMRPSDTSPDSDAFLVYNPDSNTKQTLNNRAPNTENTLPDIAFKLFLHIAQSTSKQVKTVQSTLMAKQYQQKLFREVILGSENQYQIMLNKLSPEQLCVFVHSDECSSENSTHSILQEILASGYNENVLIRRIINVCLKAKVDLRKVLEYNTDGSTLVHLAIEKNSKYTSHFVELCPSIQLIWPLLKSLRLLTLFKMCIDIIKEYLFPNQQNSLEQLNLKSGHTKSSSFMQKDTSDISSKPEENSKIPAQSNETYHIPG